MAVELSQLALEIPSVPDVVEEIEGVVEAPRAAVGVEDMIVGLLWHAHLAG